MLKLSRKQQERIYIGDDIIIEVLACRGSEVRLGIQAPKKIPIYREELLARIELNEVGASHDEQ